MVCLCEPQWPGCSQGLSQVEHPIRDTRQEEQRWKAWTSAGHRIGCGELHDHGGFGLPPNCK